MSNPVNVDFVTKVVEVEVNDTQEESLAAQAAINAAARAQEAKDVVVDNLQDSLDAIDEKTETEKTELNDYTEAKKTEIATLGQGYVDSASQKADEANTILAAIRNEYGYPFTAATAADMTDTTKIYVYTGSETGYTFGDWYYYNGSAWVDGGVYNAIAFNTDPTLTISGAAADAAVVGDNIFDITNNEIIPLEHGFVSTDDAGTYTDLHVTTGSGTKMCAIYECSEGDVFTINGTGGSGSDRLLAFYDSSKYSLGRTLASHVAKDEEFVAPANAHYLVVNFTDDSGYACVNKIIKKRVTETENNLAIISGTTSNLIDNIFENATIASNGTLSASGSTYDVYVAPVEQGKTYVFSPFSSSGYLAFYATKPNIDAASYNNSRASLSVASFTAPINGYVAIRYTHGLTNAQIELGTTPTSYVPHFTAVDYMARREIAQIEDVTDLGKRFWAYAMTSVLCIGDSLTRGASPIEDWGATTGTVPLYQNYPRTLGRMIGCDVENAGFSGISPTNWYINWADTSTPLDDKPYKVPHYDFAKFDTIIIWLGTNVTNGQLDTDDIDVDGTDTNYYCKIIDAIYTDYAAVHTDTRYGDKPLIVLMSLFGTAHGFDRDKANEAIEAISAKYGNLPIIDCSDLSQYDHPELHENRDNVHFGKAGYIYIPNRIIEELSKWFSENPTRTDYGQTQFEFDHY